MVDLDAGAIWQCQGQIRQGDINATLTIVTAGRGKGDGNYGRMGGGRILLRIFLLLTRLTAAVEAATRGGHFLNDWW